MAEAHSLVGKTLADTYAVVRQIGKGGMGAIYEAHHKRLAGKRYAIKILAPQFAENPELLTRFRREAEIASQLGHENIVEVHDFNLADGQAYMVMELLEGEDLATRIRTRGPMPLDLAKHIIDQVASALDAAHRAHIVHRDLKPPNIFLCKRGGRDDYVKVLDFGVSKVLDSSSIVTRDHALVGTPFYMSPEQADGRISEIDHRTDVFALGAIMWEMLTGKMAFGAPNFSVALYKVCFVDPPDVHTLRPDVPAAVSMVLRRALSKEQITRTATVAELATELAGALHGVMPAGIPLPAPGGTSVVMGTSQPPTGSPTPQGRAATAQPIVAPPPSYIQQPSMVQQTPAAMGTPSPSSLAGPAPWSPQPVSMPPPPSAWAPPPSIPGTVGPLANGSVYAAPRSRKVVFLVLLALATVVVVGTGIWLVVAKAEDRPPPPKPEIVAPAPTPAPVPAPVTAPSPPLPAIEEVALLFTVEPASAAAEITVEGKPVSDRRMRVEKSAGSLAVSAEAKGYQPVKLLVIPDKDQTVPIVFKRKSPPKTEPAPAKVETPPPARVEVKPAPPPPQPVVAPAPPPQPAVEKKETPPPPPPPKKKTGTIFDE